MKKWMATALGLAMLATACTKATDRGSDGTSNSWTHPHELTFADAGDVSTLNPHLGQFADIGFIASLTMAWLVKWDEHNNAYPELATQVPTKHNGGVSADGLTITYHLRKGVKWSDGAPFDADDVVWSTKAVLNPANNEVGRQGWDQISKIDEPDKYTVVYHLRKPYSPFVEVFFSTAGANPCILPKHLLASLPNINNAAYNSKPVGIGPFKVDRWDRATDVVLVANPLYWRGQPKLQKVTFKIIPDRNTLLTQMKEHQVDLYPFAAGAYLDRIKAIDGITVSTVQGYIWNHFDFNQGANPAMKDPLVRMALIYGTDRKALLQKVSHGLGYLSESPTPDSAPYAVNVTRYPFDITKANALLDQAGYKRGSDGIRAKDGNRLSLRFAAISGLHDVDTMIELVRANWKQLGVDISVQHYQTANYYAPLEEGGILYGTKWDVTGTAWQNEALGDYSQAYACSGFPPNGQNDARWCSTDADKAMHDLYGHYDQASRNKDVVAIVNAFHKDNPVMVLYQRYNAYAYNTDLKNFHPNAVSPFDNFMDVDI